MPPQKSHFNSQVEEVKIKSVASSLNLRPGTTHNISKLPPIHGEYFFLFFKLFLSKFLTLKLRSSLSCSASLTCKFGKQWSNFDSEIRHLALGAKVDVPKTSKYWKLQNKNWMWLGSWNQLHRNSGFKRKWHIWILRMILNCISAVFVFSDCYNTRPHSSPKATLHPCLPRISTVFCFLNLFYLHHFFFIISWFFSYKACTQHLMPLQMQGIFFLSLKWQLVFLLKRLCCNAW